MKVLVDAFAADTTISGNWCASRIMLDQWIIPSPVSVEA